MTHSEAVEVALDRFWDSASEEPFRDMIEAAITAYLEARGAVLCEREPTGWLYQFKDQPPVFSLEKRDWADTHQLWKETPLHAALSDKPKGEAQ